MSPLELMRRDLDVLGGASGVIFLLPVLSAVAVCLGRRLAVVPLVLSVVLGAVWYLSYEWDVANPGLAGAGLAALAVAVGWAILIVAAVWAPKDRSSI